MHRLLVPSLLLAAAALPAPLSAAEPLGMVESVDGKSLVLRFDAAATAGRLAPGGMVAIYAAGAVEKHPLTKEVIIERPVVIAKAQLTALMPTTTAKILWQAQGRALIAGLDAVPIPEAAPNSPPALTGPATAVSVKAGHSLLITAPLSDPDGDGVGYTWSLTSPGQSGLLSARTTTTPQITWSAPATPGQWMLAVTARDALGQTGKMEIPISATEAADPAGRELAVVARYGEGQEPALQRLRRDADGHWWGLDANGQVWRSDAGWHAVQPPAFGDQGPKRAAALALAKGELFVLDTNRNGVGIYGPDGIGRRWIPGLEKPTDLAVAPDGAILVADQGLGGVVVFEADGRCRCRLGRSGATPDAFVGLIAVACDPAGAVYALDAGARRVARFDRFLRSLAPWTVPTDEKDLPVDVTASAKGCLVLLASGRIVAFDQDGKAGETWPSLQASGLVSETGKATGFVLDTTGETVVTYPTGGLLARYDEQGRLTGVRGAELRTAKHAAADGLGRLVAVTSLGQIALFDGDGWLTALLGPKTKEGGALKEPVGIAVTGDGRTAYALDASASQVVRFDLANPQAGHQVFAQKGSSTGQLASPVAIATDDAGRCYVLDEDNYRVTVYDQAGQFLFEFARKGSGPGDLDEPKYLAVSPAGDRAYIYDADSYQIKAYKLDQAAHTASHLASSIGKGDAPGQLRGCLGLGVDRQGLVWALDGKRGDLQIIDFRAGAPVAVVQKKLAEAGVKNPAGLALNPDGTAWIPMIGGGFSSAVVGITGLR